MGAWVRCGECGGRGEVKWEWASAPVIKCPACGGTGRFWDATIASPPGPVNEALSAAWKKLDDKLGEKVAPALESLERRTPGGMPVLAWVVFPLLAMGAVVLFHLLTR